MKEVIKQLMVYVIIVSALRGLLTNPKYEEYFRFFSGMIMILMLLTPILSFLGKSTGWYYRLEANFLNMDIQEIKGTLKVADAGFEKMVTDKYSEALEKEVEVLAKEEGIVLTETKVLLAKGKEGLEVAEISGKTGGKKDGRESSGEAVVETIQIGEDQKRIWEAEDESEEAEGLRDKICEKFVLEKEKVHLWK